MLTALEIIDSLKESMKKADENNSLHNRVDVKNPSFSANNLNEENLNSNKDEFYDQQVILTEKENSNINNISHKYSTKYDNSANIYESGKLKNLQSVRKDNQYYLNNESAVKTNNGNNNLATNTTIETGEGNIVNMNNTYDYNQGNKSKDVSPFKNSKSTTNKKNIQINIPDNVNQFSVPQDKLLNLNLYSNKANMNKNFNMNNNAVQDNKYAIESDKKALNSKPKYQQMMNNNNNIKSPVHSSYKDNMKNSNFSNSKNYNINYNQNAAHVLNNNHNENFEDTVNNIKNSMLSGMNNENKKFFENQNNRNFNNINNSQQKGSSKVKHQYQIFYFL